eukprot:CAMPEP_0168242662 /NCGR_PEP_ID=MMETSP0140_2-20121125/23572_1 /TAXON_ID=44445 /ORGANISM="Pseudo-nitzschia australis, Strain 10249 10 AB" /LENGTH=79 /DNA_ID=CAMNT_0008177843 /DNA_START=72 /DNA_END=311 /DNA_ORIENTATION=+
MTSPGFFDVGSDSPVKVDSSIFKSAAGPNRAQSAGILAREWELTNIISPTTMSSSMTVTCLPLRMTCLVLLSNKLRANF